MVRLDRAAARRLAGLRRVTLSVVVTATPLGAGATTTRRSVVLVGPGRRD